MEQLLVLDRCKEKKDIDTSILKSWMGPIVTPAKVPFWQAHLASHNDKRFSHWIVQGFTEGFWIGYTREEVRSSRKNMLSAGSHKDVVSTYLKGELQEGRVACCGPLNEANLLKIHISPFSVIPKKGRPTH